MAKLKRVLLTVKEHDKLRKNPPDNLVEPVYYIIKGERKTSMQKIKKKYTLDQIGDALFKFIDTTNKRFDSLETRLDRVEKRLDYNGLKDLPRNR